jgi:hypothetical protein
MRCDHAFLRCLAKLEIPREYDRLLARPMEIGANDLSEAPFTNSSTFAGRSPYSATQKLSGIVEMPFDRPQPLGRNPLRLPEQLKRQSDPLAPEAF